MDNKNHIEYRFGWFLLVSLLFVGVVLDVVGAFLPIVDIAIDVVASLGFWLIYKLNNIDVGFTNPRRLAVQAVTLLGELIDGVDVLPLWTAGVIITYFMVRFEDKTGVSVPVPGGKTKLTAKRVKAGFRRSARALKDPKRAQRVVERRNNIARIRAERKAQGKTTSLASPQSPHINKKVA